MTEHLQAFIAGARECEIVPMVELLKAEFASAQDNPALRLALALEHMRLKRRVGGS